MFSKLVTSLLRIFACNFVTGCGCEYTGFALSFNLKSTGSVSHVPRLPSIKLLYFCRANNSACFVTIKFCHFLVIVLCKSAFSYFSLIIVRNILVALHTGSGSLQFFIYASRNYFSENGRIFPLMGLKS